VTSSHSLRFELLEATSTRLWDFGWFDGSGFLIVGGDPSAAARIFCTTPDSWGGPVDHHGLAELRGLSIEAYSAISADELSVRIDSALSDPQFSSRRDVGQAAPVIDWLKRVRGQDCELFAFELGRVKQVDFALVWFLFHELLAVDPHRCELSVAVIGYD